MAPWARHKVPAKSLRQRAYRHVNKKCVSVPGASRNSSGRQIKMVRIAPPRGWFGAGQVWGSMCQDSIVAWGPLLRIFVVPSTFVTTVMKY